MATELDYLKGCAVDLGYSVATDDRTVRGVVLTVQAFQPALFYGNRVRITAWKCQVTYVGESVADGSCFDQIELLDAAFVADQTAGGIADDVSVTQWDLQEFSKGLATFATTITVRRS